jgi:hypothetical protein
VHCWSWVDAGAKGVAVGLSHVGLTEWRSASTVLASYRLEMSGSQVASQTFALQHLFAPVGAAKCRLEGARLAVLFGVSSA